MRVGSGYDVHRLVQGRRLVLGGVPIPHDKGLEGHSDADVLLHAVCDALLGAAGLEDIGRHFPDTDGRFKDISSLLLLARTYDMVRRDGFTLVNLDATIFAQKPRMSPHRAAMRERISETLNVTPSSINIKATTTEGLGFIGRGEGIGAMCVALIQ